MSVGDADKRRQTHGMCMLVIAINPCLPAATSVLRTCALRARRAISALVMEPVQARECHAGSVDLAVRPTEGDE